MRKLIRAGVTKIAGVVAVVASTVAPAVAQQPAPAAPETATIRGVVVIAGTSTPIRRATVVLARPGGRWTAITDINGRFTLEDVPSGDARLTASKAGYITMALGQGGPSVAGAPIRLAPGQILNDALIPLTRASALSGRVVDEFGDPVVNAFVQAFRPQYVNGFRQVTPVSNATTDDLGHYRIFGLRAGRYYVASSYQPIDWPVSSTMPDPTAVARGGTGFAPTFFPGTASAGDARGVTLSAGVDVDGVDVQLIPARLARISGTVLTLKGEASSRVLVILYPSRRDRAMVTLPPIVAPVDSSGRFEVSNVPPGDYRLDARLAGGFEAVARGGGIGQVINGSNGEWAAKAITVSGEDIEAVTLTMARGFKVNGRVSPALSAAEVARVRVSAADLASPGLAGFMTTSSTNVQPDGTFQLDGVNALRILQVSGLPATWTVKSIRTTLDITDSGLEVVDDVEGVVIELAAPTHLTGSVLDITGQPVAAAGVLVFASDSSKWATLSRRHVRSATMTREGTFSLDGLPPGEYFIAAVDAIEDGEWAEEDNLRSLQPRATRITLAEGESKSLFLRILP